jgi:hypothetical protein
MQQTSLLRKGTRGAVRDGDRRDGITDGKRRVGSDEDHSATSYVGRSVDFALGEPNSAAGVQSGDHVLSNAVEHG